MEMVGPLRKWIKCAGTSYGLVTSKRTEIDQLAMLWDRLLTVQLEGEPDLISWKGSADGEYSAKAAYKAHFLQAIPQPLLNSVWSIKASSFTMRSWWRCIVSGPKSETKKETTMAAIIVWHLWKERNNRVFQQKECNSISLYRLIEDEFCLLLEAIER
ncbi:hypothetical protein BRADI_4g18232v3 [Brachypodium distachyon]|uniref:Reverse transcriptase zinc-binding domain-containing protein n=1 Tax=Brachypodium distachyon TaxID=15368 RepID=A0A2K2CNH9_BRADI|nr:hypothetical protein BRADI_4g18232v3 [Brachypodium distachyon]